MKNELNTNRRYVRRFFSRSKSLHVVFKSNHAILRMAMNKKRVETLLQIYAKKFAIKIHRYSINSNHIHLSLNAENRQDLINFFRVFSGQVAQKLLNAVRGKKCETRFWAQTVWSRVVQWGRDFRGVLNYILRNQLEAEGAIAYLERGNRAKSNRNRDRPKLRSRTIKKIYQPSLF
jgi:REP element-mobilizing transposase RayT